MNKNSALYWYPKVKDVDGVNIPKTRLVSMSTEDIILLRHNIDEFKYTKHEEYDEIFEEFTFPIFLKTDELAGKHDWKETCYVESKDDFYQHLRNLLIMTSMVNVRFDGFLIREFIDLEAPFSFFHGDMPVAKERRYFVRDGKVICHHSYWDTMVFEDTFNRDDQMVKLGLELKFSKEKRKEILDTLQKLNTETQEEIPFLSSMAKRIGEVLDGSWSIDFACDKNGTWWFIDCAVAKDSWHPECPKKDIFM